MVISQPPNNPSYYYRASPTLPRIALNASRDTLCSLYMQLQHQGNSTRNGAIKHIFYTESDPRRDHQRIVLYSFCRSMRLLFI